MATNKNKKKWNARLKIADNAYLNELLQNFGLSGGLSTKDLPWIPLSGMAVMGVGSKIRELKERHRQENSDNQNVGDFRGDISKVRDILDSAKRDHPSVPGFAPKGPYDWGEEPVRGDDPYDQDEELPRNEGPYDQGQEAKYVNNRSPYDQAKERANTRSPQGDGEAPNNVFDIRSGRPIFNSLDQGKPQKGRPFERDEE